MNGIVVVTGGSRGIGREINRILTTNNYKVISVSRSTPVNKIDEVQYMNCDVTDEGLVQETINQVVKEHGHLDVLINAAGINRDSLLVKARKDDMMSQIMTNLLGTMFMCKSTVKHMMSSKSGAIVNIGSVVGQHGNPGQSVYSATKSGLVGFTKSLAKEVGSRGITANVITPGYIKTDMTEKMQKSSAKYESLIPLHRFGEAEEVAEMVLFLIQQKYITGQVLYCDGGLHTMV